MSAKSETLYLKIDQNTIVTDRHVTLGDIAKMECPDASIVRQLKQKKIYTFAEAMNPRKQKNQMKVFSILKIVELIHEEYPNVDISNEGEKDFIIEYIPNPEKPKWINALKTVALCVVIFFGAAFTIMAFNNDINVTELFAQVYEQCTGAVSDGYTILEISYSLGLSVGIILFFNHVGGRRITKDPTPIEVEMRVYETDVNKALIETADREGKSIDVS